MKRKLNLLILILLSGCSPINEIKNNQDWKPIYRIQVGIGKGGVTENTDMAVVSNAEVDAFSGSTKTSFNCGGRIILPMKRNSVETGIDYLHNSQIFVYKDINNNYHGSRNINTSQVMIPLVYNIPLFRKNSPHGLIQVKLGYLAQINFFTISSSGSSLPGYNTKVFSNGLIIGFSSNPIRLRDGRSMGFYLEGYRGSQIYEDFYNKTEYQMPGTSFLKYGVFFEF